MSEQIVVGSFCWDRDKELQNIKKHGVDFLTATEVFSDPAHLILDDNIHSGLETRYFCIGKAKGMVITVRFTYRFGLVRIIGAGHWRKWREVYEKKKMG